MTERLPTAAGMLSVKMRDLEKGVSDVVRQPAKASMPWHLQCAMGYEQRKCHTIHQGPIHCHVGNYHSMQHAPSLLVQVLRLCDLHMNMEMHLTVRQ